MNHKDELLRLEAVSKRIGATFLLGPISVSQRRGEKIGLAGASGSGKSTLLQIIAGLQQADSGNLYFKQKVVRGPNYQLIPGEAGIAYLSQYFELRNQYRIGELLDYANALDDQQAAALYRLCRIEQLLGRKNKQLSGGEQQRVALARLLATQPELLLLDEPFSNSDPMQKEHLKVVLAQLTEAWGLSMIMASHDPADLLSWADRIYLLHDGVLLQQGDPHTVYHHPVNEIAAGLLGPYEVLPSALTQRAGWVLPQAIIRPERLLLSDPNRRGVNGTITKKVFAGPFSVYTVQTEWGTVRCRTTEDHYGVGAHVGLSLRQILT